MLMLLKMEKEPHYLMPIIWTREFSNCIKWCLCLDCKLNIVDTHFRDTFSTSSTQSSPASLWAQFMYYIFILFFKHGSSPCDLLGEIEGAWFGGYGPVPFGPFAWAQPMRATKWARDTSSVGIILKK